jgi:polyisoprenoid-binding protein YceI
MTAIGTSIALLATASIATSLASDQQVELKFVATQAEVPISGRFKTVKADLAFDPAKPSPGDIRIVVDTASVDTGSAEADTLLKGRDFFDTARFPQALFTSSSITTQGTGRLLASGRFALKGRDLPLTIPFSARPDGPVWRLEGSVALSRLAYDVGKGEWSDTGTLADTVVISFKLLVPR